MLHLYAIAAAPPPPGLAGIAGAPVRAVAHEELHAVYAELPAAARGVQPMLEHERVVEALMARGPVLPARFGSAVATADELRAQLLRRAAGFRAQLARVEGCVEVAVHGPAAAGLGDGARAVAERAPDEVAYLVAAGDAGAFRERAARAGLRCTGPWPPYSFAGDLENALSRRVEADPESVERGLAQLVLTIVELLRQLMERQALRRIDAGGLSGAEVERLDRTFALLAERMEELKDVFGLEQRDLNLDLGPLGRLL